MLPKSPRVSILIFILIITPLGFVCKFYQGPFASWASNSLAGVFYELFWCLIIKLLYLKTSSFRVATIVFIVTCLLEFLQLVQTPLLQAVRSTFIGSTLIGTDFTWSDFPYYAAGCFIGWILMKRLV